MTEKGQLEARITFNGVTQEFAGEFDEVSRAIMQFLFGICPNLSLLSKIQFRVDESRLVEDIVDVIKFDKEGAIAVADLTDSSDEDRILIHLSAVYIGHRIGFLETNSLTIDEMHELTGIKRNPLNIRLSRLAKKRLVEIPETGRRRITSQGLALFVNQILPQLKEQVR